MSHRFLRRLVVAALLLVLVFCLVARASAQETARVSATQTGFMQYSIDVEAAAPPRTVVHYYLTPATTSWLHITATEGIIGGPLGGCDDDYRTVIHCWSANQTETTRVKFVFVETNDTVKTHELFVCIDGACQHRTVTFQPEPLQQRFLPLLRKEGGV